jgi:hypothetical protein
VTLIDVCTRNRLKMHDTAAMGDIKGVRPELSRRDAFDARDEQDNTPLGWAARSPDADETTLQILWEAGADVCYIAPKGDTLPLLVVYARHDDEQMTEIVQFLMDEDKILRSLIKGWSTPNRKSESDCWNSGRPSTGQSKS